MANYNGGFTFPSPQPNATIIGFTQFTPNSTHSTNNIQFPSPPLSTPMLLNGGIMCSASNSRPTTSHCMAVRWNNQSSTTTHTIQWAPTTVASPEMTLFNTAAANFNNSVPLSTSPIPSTSGISGNSAMNRSKRKSSATDLSARRSTSSEEPENKILVNEERMAARMQELHLDNNNLDWHPDLEQQQEQQQQQQQHQRQLQLHGNNNEVDEAWYTSSSRLQGGVGSHANDGVFLTNCSTSSSEEDIYESDSSNGGASTSSGARRQRSKSCPKLDFSPELELTLKTKRLLPRVILDELNKPCMQVMLWKPPGDVTDIMAGINMANKELEPSHYSVEVSDNSERKPSTVQPNIWSIPAGEDNLPITVDEDNTVDDPDTMEL